MPLEPKTNGLLARAGEYEPLRAFSQGGRYWDREPQQLIREGGLAEFLPPVETEEDDRGKFGRFFCRRGRKEILSRSKPLGNRGVPTEQLQRLRQAIDEFKLGAGAKSAQPQNRELIERFRLPDPAHDPELYRLAGPWWDRRLQILWGCERTRDSSLPAAAALEKLREDRAYNARRLFLLLLLLLLLLLPAWWLATHWPFTHRQTEQAAAEKAEADAKRPQAAAEKAREDALAARKAADRAKAATNSNTTPATNGSGKQPPANTNQLTAPDIKTCQIVLCDQGQPAPDGTMEVALEVRTSAKPPRAVPVEAWQFDGQTVTGQDRLQTRMKGGNHPVKAVILDAQGKRSEISATVTVDPAKVITTPGKVSIRPR